MTTQVTYIGKRETYRDGLYETGEWTHGETKPVHDDVARKMLRHQDQYEQAGAQKSRAAAKEPASAEHEPLGKLDENKSKPQEGDDAQDLRDAVALMDKEALASFAKTHFSVDLHHNLGLDKARTKVIGLIDQYGVA